MRDVGVGMCSQSPSLQRRAVRVPTLAMHAARQPQVRVSGLEAGRCAPAALGARSSAPMRRMPRRRRRCCRSRPGGSRTARRLRSAGRAFVCGGWSRARPPWVRARARMRCHHEHSIQIRKILGRLFAKYKMCWPPNPAITGSRHGRPWCKPRPGPGAALLAGAAHAFGPQRTWLRASALNAPRRRPCAVPAAAGAGAAQPQPGRGAGLPHRRGRVGVAVLRGLPPVRAGARAAAVCGSIEIVMYGRLQPGRTPLCCAAMRALMCLKARSRGGAAWAQSNVA